MDLTELVRRRRMVRRYQAETVPRETIRRILDVARRAPSAGFSQGQRFVVVTEEPLRAAIARLAGEDGYVARGFEPWLSSAPVHVVVCADEEAYRRRYASPDKAASQPERWPVSFSQVDAGASLMLLLLAAVDEGFGAGFMGAHRLEGIRGLLDIPPDTTVLGLVTLGRPAPDRRSASLEAGWKALDEVVHWERWAGPPG